jgi:hypothetical protein
MNSETFSDLQLEKRLNKFHEETCPHRSAPNENLSFSPHLFFFTSLPSFASVQLPEGIFVFTASVYQLGEEARGHAMIHVMNTPVARPERPPSIHAFRLPPWLGPGGTTFGNQIERPSSAFLLSTLGSPGGSEFLDVHPLAPDYRVSQRTGHSSSNILPRKKRPNKLPEATCSHQSIPKESFSFSPPRCFLSFVAFVRFCSNS